MLATEFDMFWLNLRRTSLTRLVLRLSALRENTVLTSNVEFGVATLSL